MMNKNIGIYVFETWKHFYIGCSTQLDVRKEQHWRRLINQEHPNPLMQSIYNKDYEYEFEFRVLEYCNEEQLEYLEKYWFDRYSSENQNKKPINLKECGKRATYSYEAKVRMSKGKIKREYDFNQRYSLYDYDTDELLYVGDIFEVSKYSNVSITELTTLKKSFSEVFNTNIYMIENFEFIPLEEQITINDIYY